MTSHRTSLLALAVAAGGALTLTLSGCTAIQEAFSQEITTEFASANDVADRWDTEVPWLPADATEIIAKEKPDGEVSALMAHSPSPLAPETCVEVDRRSAPTVNVDTAPDVYGHARVFACGTWSVIPTDDGWYGWTPNSADEMAQSPSSRQS